MDGMVTLKHGLVARGILEHAISTLRFAIVAFGEGCGEETHPTFQATELKR